MALQNYTTEIFQEDPPYRSTTPASCSSSRKKNVTKKMNEVRSSVNRKW